LSYNKKKDHFHFQAGHKGIYCRDLAFQLLINPQVQE